ncbi:hypothetical protein K438DRAFT_1978069 [Mycena galopus ATCC 62051]|nr:hypothetical protein K438DRAFT_1978069 [Mycena galopus ATCC 62051]
MATVTRLLKKLSAKSLRRRSQSTTNSRDVPRPTLQSFFSTITLGYAVPEALNDDSNPYVLTPGSYLEKSCPQTPNTTQVSPPPPPVVATNGNAVPQDDLSKDLQGAWASATTDPKGSKADKVLLQLENAGTGMVDRETKGASIVDNVQTALTVVGGMEIIENGFNSFMDGMPVLMNALDEVAKIHPFIAVAVMAFKAVWVLEQARRDNDKKILALHMEMKDMMGVLTQLRNVKDVNETAPDGKTIKGRMQELAKKTAEDIKSCANACDTYTKTRTLVKVLKGPIWEQRLVKFVGIFTDRRGDFEFALSIHTALGVDAVNRTAQDLNAKMDMMLKLFQQFVSPEQKEMARLVEERGGQAVLDDDKALEELNDWENKSSGSQAISGSKTTKPSDLKDLKDDLNVDPDSAIDQNMTKFSRKLNFQTRQISEEMNRATARQGDRIISAMSAGPHDRIIDPNVHNIWKEMGWRGSVKARHFVMSLRDYFQEAYTSKAADGKSDGQATIVVDKADEWALQYISVARLQAISEAFDDDASGFVTVAEANAFTSARPLDWSLPRWIAYWAIGHHQVLQTYATKINELLAKMVAIMPKMLPVNRSSANGYLETIYRGVYTLTASVNPCYVNNGLQERFASYTKAEEARIRGNLEAIDYDIDASGTLELVTGKNHIDRYVLLVIYLVLERHFEILRVGQTRTLDSAELSDAKNTLNLVFEAVSARVELLRSIFKHSDMNQQFKGFAFGMYAYMNQPNLLWDPDVVLNAEIPECTYDDSVEAQDVDVTKILHFPVDQELVDFNAYAPLGTEAKHDADDPKMLRATEGILGLWHGYLYSPSTDEWPLTGMISMHFKPSSTQGEVQYFSASERGYNGAEFKITGECRAGDEPGTASISFERTFTTGHATEYYTGKWDAATVTLTGTVNFAAQDGAFVFKRNITPEHMCFWPAPVQLRKNKARALWAFAIAAVRFDVRRSRWAWSFFNERRDRRRRFIELHIRSDGSATFGLPLNAEEHEELARIRKSMTTADSRFYHSLAELQIRLTTEHNDHCDACGTFISGARISCLVCQIKDSLNTVDFCSTPGCIANRVMRKGLQKAHTPHHDLLKLRRVVHTRQLGKTYRDAREALQKARTFFKLPSSAMVDKMEEVSASELNAADAPGHAPASAQPSSILPLAMSIPWPRSPDSGLGRSPSSAVFPALSHSEQVPEPGASGGPPCCVCKQPVSQPCWYCVQCADASFVCWECDAKSEVLFAQHDFHTREYGVKGEVSFNFGQHDFHSHDLVRVQELVEEKELTVEERLGDLEARFSKHENAMDSRLSRMDSYLGQIDVQLGQMDSRLDQLLEHHKKNWTDLIFSPKTPTFE